MGQDPTQGRENTMFRTGRRDPKVVSLLEVRKKRQRDRRSKTSEFLHGRIQLAKTSFDIPARIEGKTHDPLAVLVELAGNEIFVLLLRALVSGTMDDLSSPPLLVGPVGCVPVSAVGEKLLGAVRNRHACGVPAEIVEAKSVDESVAGFHGLDLGAK